LNSFATWSLTAISLAAGWLLGWGFLRLSNRKALAGAANRLRAHLMELRLFADEPALVWTAQWDLIKANGIFLWWMLKPLAVLALPAALLMWQLEPYYASTPLRPGEAALLTLEAEQPATGEPTLQPMQFIGVETQAIQWNNNRSATWRVRAAAAGIAHLPLTWNFTTMQVEVAAGDELLRLPSAQSHERARILVNYPEREYSVAGWRMGWAAWFVLWSSAAALAAVWWFR
jgi:hypothetical protein